MHKLGVDNLVDLIKRVASMGLVDLEEIPEQDEDKPDSENDEQVIPPYQSNSKKETKRNR